MNIGYIRVSTQEQNEARQIELLTHNGVELENIYIEKKSGKNTNREELKRMMSFIRKGDKVIVESISRIARNTRDLLNIIDELEKKEVAFVSIKESIDTATPQGRFMLTVFGALAELERENILERQREGIQIAKKEGKYHGKPKKKIDKERFCEICARWRNGEITAKKAMEMTGLSRNTFYRRVNEWGL